MTEILRGPLTALKIGDTWIVKPEEPGIGHVDERMTSDSMDAVTGE